ncbi:uncharacterized protein [Periplaneta americana]|uniref:uncharacterized protein n=1 Tax=Periplaneta americana TaxID=6978 RepID=UPI0037E89F62
MVNSTNNSQQQDCNSEEVIEEPDNSLLLHVNVAEEESERDSESSVSHQRPFINFSYLPDYSFIYYQQRFERMSFQGISPEYAGVRYELFRRFWGQSRDSNQEFFSYTWIVVHYFNRQWQRRQQQHDANARWNAIHQLHPPNSEYMVRNRFPPSGPQALGVRSLLHHRTPWQYLQGLQFSNYFIWDNFLLLYLRNTARNIGRNLSRIAIDFDSSPRRREMQEAAYSVRWEDLNVNRFGELLFRFVQGNDSIPHAVVVAAFLGCDLAIRALVENFVLFLPAPFRPYVIGRLNNWLRDHGGLIGAFNYLRNRPYGTASVGIGMFAIFIFRHYRAN